MSTNLQNMATKRTDHELIMIAALQVIANGAIGNNPPYLVLDYKGLQHFAQKTLNIVRAEGR